MKNLTSHSPTLVFRVRPKPVPGDLRISWRLPMTLLALNYCRRKRASFAKLHILNDALRSNLSRRRIVDLLSGHLDYKACTIRVEPAFSRNLDLMIGKGLAEWVIASGRLNVQLTSTGVNTANAIARQDEVLIEEKAFLAESGRRVTEQIVHAIVTAGNRSLA